MIQSTRRISPVELDLFLKNLWDDKQISPLDNFHLNFLNKCRISNLICIPKIRVGNHANFRDKRDQICQCLFVVFAILRTFFVLRYLSLSQRNNFKCLFKRPPHIIIVKTNAVVFYFLFMKRGNADTKFSQEVVLCSSLYFCLQPSPPY